MKVLITGGCGFLGSNLASAFLADGAEVVVLDALFRKGSASNLHWLEEQAAKHQFHFSQADIAEAEEVQAVFRRHGPFDFICHVAGQVAMTKSLHDPYRDLKTNLIGTFNILEATRTHSPEALLAYSSTNKVYGDLEWIAISETQTRYIMPDFPSGLDESIPLDFSTPYGCSKGAADQYVRDWSRVYDLNTVVFRHSSIYGGRQYATFDQGWVGWFCSQALQQQQARHNQHPIKPFTVAGTGKQVRDVLHAEDLIGLYKAAYQHKSDVKGKIYNIGGGKENSLSILELFNILSVELSIPQLDYTLVSRRSSDQDSFVADIKKVSSSTGWVPSVDMHTGIRKHIDWCKSLLGR
jgi:CDP-paratose 2-epimerase